MSSKSRNQYWIQTTREPLGPVDWKVAREWFALKWLEPQTNVSESDCGPWVNAATVNKFWKGTKEIEKRIDDFEDIDLEAEKIPISRLLAERIISLNWPGEIKALKNYYWANRLREQLESLFPSLDRKIFDDPNCPSGLSRAHQTSPTVASHDYYEDPITPAQNELLCFFLGVRHGIISKGEASDRIEELLDDVENEKLWQQRNASVPATQRQLNRLKWWSEKIRRKLPHPLTKAQASDLIDKWQEEYPDLELDWHEYKQEISSPPVLASRVSIRGVGAENRNSKSFRFSKLLIALLVTILLAILYSALGSQT